MVGRGVVLEAVKIASRWVSVGFGCVHHHGA